MFLNLENLEIKNKEYQKGFDGFSFFYKSTKYYFKYHKKAENFYNELIAEKIASRLNIPCCHYDLAYYLDDYGVVSKSFDHPNYISMKDYLVEKYSKDECDERNTLEDIWDAFFLDFKEETVKRLMDELVNIFIFDCLIGNSDRHNENLGLILEGENTHFAPLFDNELMLSPYAIEDGYYSIKVEKFDAEKSADKEDEDINILYEFLDDSDRDYQSVLTEKLNVISDKSIHEIFLELEEENIMIERPIKNIIRNKFAKNREMINNYFQNRKTNQILKGMIK